MRGKKMETDEVNRKTSAPTARRLIMGGGGDDV